MEIYEVEKRTAQLLTSLLDIWEGSVRATHHFLSDAEIDRIREYVPQALTGVKHLIVAKNDRGEPVAFLGTVQSPLEKLCLSASEPGKRIGTRLLQYGVQNYGIREVTVNEQNPQAVGFYEHFGFQTYKRTDLDEQGDPYPLLYMKLM